MKEKRHFSSQTEMLSLYRLEILIVAQIHRETTVPHLSLKRVVDASSESAINPHSI
jgi:hypothetical protein